MVNFANGRIYVIRSNKTDQVYIGSTCVSLSKRMTQHRSDFKRNRIKSSSELIKHGDAYIELIEKFPCKDREELFKREGEVMRATLNTVNKQLPGRTKKKYRDEHKVEIAVQQKQYYENNKEQIAVKAKQYYENNKEALSIQQKKYHADNREARLARMRKYRDTHKEHIKIKDKQYRAKIIRCECGASVSRCYIANHKKTKIHKTEMEILELAGEL